MAVIIVNAYSSQFAFDYSGLAPGTHTFVSNMSLSEEAYDGFGYYGPGIQWDNVTVTVNMPACVKVRAHGGQQYPRGCDPPTHPVWTSPLPSVNRLPA